MDDIPCYGRKPEQAGKGLGKERVRWEAETVRGRHAEYHRGGAGTPAGDARYRKSPCRADQKELQECSGYAGCADVCREEL